LEVTKIGYKHKHPCLFEGAHAINNRESPSQKLRQYQPYNGQNQPKSVNDLETSTPITSNSRLLPKMAALVCNTAPTTWDADTIDSNSAIEAVTSENTNSNVHFLSFEVPIAFLDPGVKAPFKAIQQLFDHLQSSPEDAAALNATYPRRGIHKTAATSNPTSDQKFTIDLSPNRSESIPSELSASLSNHGLQEVLTFFNTVDQTWSTRILDSLRVLSGGVDLTPAHRAPQVNFRICDYNPQTASPESDKGCGAHTDYGTFSIIFQDGAGGLEFEDPNSDDTWIPIPGDATVVLAGWCAVILTGAGVVAARHRVRRTPGVRRLSAVLFMAPQPDTVLSPLAGSPDLAKQFSKPVKDGELTVGWFKEFMGKKWRHREGNEDLDSTADLMSQDDEIRQLIWG
jgi:hypothetical protein